VTKRFKVKGEKSLVELYKPKMAVERALRLENMKLMMENLKWRG